MSVARFIADQRAMHRVPHAVTCAILGVSVSWFYKWVHREPTPTEVRRSELDAAVKAAFEASKRTYGSPRIHADLVEAGWMVSVNTVADSMRDEACRVETKAPQGNNQAGQDRAEVPGSAEARLHRAGGECEVVWRHDRDPDR